MAALQYIENNYEIVYEQDDQKLIKLQNRIQKSINSYLDYEIQEKQILQSQQEAETVLLPQNIHGEKQATQQAQEFNITATPKRFKWESLQLETIKLLIENKTDKNVIIQQMQDQFGISRGNVKRKLMQLTEKEFGKESMEAE